MKIVVLEKIEITKNQLERLKQMGDVELYENSTERECKERIRGADVVIIDWIDPSSFILSMKSPSLLALMSTSYYWVKNRLRARKKGILISNIPGYAAEAVAEHIICLLLCVARQTIKGDREIRAGNKEKGYLEGIELRGRRIGIIGLGHIGRRVAQISKGFGMEVVTYNRNPKNFEDILDVSLEELLFTSDIICISCSLNDESRGMLDKKKLNLIKDNAIIVGATWDIVILNDLIALLKNGIIRGVGFDVANKGENIILPSELLQLDNVIFTPHIGYKTIEATIQRVEICLSNINAFKLGEPINIINNASRE